MQTIRGLRETVRSAEVVAGDLVKEAGAGAEAGAEAGAAVRDRAGIDQKGTKGDARRLVFEKPEAL